VNVCCTCNFIFNQKVRYHRDMSLDFILRMLNHFHISNIIRLSPSGNFICEVSHQNLCIYLLFSVYVIIVLEL
jgi:hypothetical protein